MQVQVWNQSLKSLGPGHNLQTTHCAEFIKKLPKASRSANTTNNPIHKCACCILSSKRGRSDECSFKNIRAICLRTKQVYIGSFSGQTSFQFPQVFTSPITHDTRLALSRGVAQTLLPKLLIELETLRSYDKGTVLLRARPLQTREICDLCRMSIFGTSWFCSSCGQDICPECYSDLTTNPTLCASTQINHEQTNFMMSSRFLQEELTNTVQKMQNLLDQSPYYLNLQTIYFQQNDLLNSEATSSILRIPGYALRPHEFRCFLTRRLPVVITHLNNILQLAWSPEHLVAAYGEDDCTMEDCEAQAKPLATTLSEFMKHFKHKIDNIIWKVKDWPPKVNLAVSHPTLYKDFARALPVADYTRRDGGLNLAAHFPTNSKVQPDLGPKVYMALASTQTDGFSGSTRLHCDLCDAINILVFSTSTTGTALWHIFKAEDAPLVRQFIREEFDHIGDDPIHSQQYYLSPSHLEQLKSKYGVIPFIIYQSVGEAIYIPAGCPHQVSNEAHCIKVASDFLSVEALSVCEQLASEFREENLHEVWKDDVLQLHTQLYYA